MYSLAGRVFLLVWATAGPSDPGEAGEAFEFEADRAVVSAADDQGVVYARLAALRMTVLTYGEQGEELIADRVEMPDERP